MINRHELKSEQIKSAIENGEFGKDIIASKDIAVVIMTQDWCPQWHRMSEWIYKTDLTADIDIYELIYNKTEHFKEFMNLKESKWGNDQIPYLRYYKKGKLIYESNYVGSEKFKAMLEE
jgi:hypothetical protein